jgi:integrase
LIGARWAEFDLKAGRWDMPAERMKMKTPHIVPLSSQAVNILKTLHLVSGHGLWSSQGSVAMKSL